MCVGVCGIGYASEQKATQESISKEEEAGSCTKKADFCSEAGQSTSFLCTSAVHVGIELLFTYQISVDEGKKFLLMG